MRNRVKIPACVGRFRTRRGILATAHALLLAVAASALLASSAAADICQTQAITADPEWPWLVIDQRVSKTGCSGNFGWNTVDPFTVNAANGFQQQACFLPAANVSKFPLPPDFVITTQKFVGIPNQCLQGSNPTPHPRMTIRIPSSTGSTIICDPKSASNPDGESNVPSDFTVYAEAPTFADRCTDPAVDFSIHVADPDGDVSCEYGQVPEGFVVTSRSPLPGACTAISGGVRELIKKPTPGEGLPGVCTDSEAPIPENFGYKSPGPSSHCGTGGTEYDLVPAEHGAIFCSPQHPKEFIIEHTSLALSGTCDTQHQYHLFDPLDDGDPFNAHRACFYSASDELPDGFVVTNHVLNDGQCQPTLSAQTIRTPNPDANPDTINVCMGSPVPQGWVITDRFNPINGECDYNDKRWTLRHMDPGESATVCSFSPIPDGFFFHSPTSGCDGQGRVSITDTFTPGARACTTNLPAGYVVNSIELDSRCAGGLSYGYTQPPNTGAITQACAPISLYPSNFVITSREASHSACLGTPRMAIRVPQLGTSETICSGSSIPGGWVVTDYAPEIASPCAGDANVRTIENVENAIGGGSTVNVCSGSPVPSDYVIVDILPGLPGKTCWPSGAVWTIRRPNSQGVTTVCNGSAVPAGFTTVGSPGTGCNGAGTFQIQALEPTPFIGVEPDVTSPPAPVSPQCPAPGTPGLLTGNATPNEAVCE